MTKWLSAATAVVVLATNIASCGSPSSEGTQHAASTSKRAATGPVHGGTAYFAEQPESAPNYIFPLISYAQYTAANTAGSADAALPAAVLVRRRR